MVWCFVDGSVRLFFCFCIIGVKVRVREVLGIVFWFRDFFILIEGVYVFVFRVIFLNFFSVW